MSAARYPLSRIRTPRRGVTMIELAVALSVITGLAFVSVRISNMTLSEPRPVAAGTTLRSGAGPVALKEGGAKMP
jgi:prepilin-type N-terminal cleavage/methylation domain-containing protein